MFPEGGIARLTTFMVALAGRNAASGSDALSSQTPRPPMLPFELLGELFQFAEREPEFAPLSQLAPRSAASIRALPMFSAWTSSRRLAFFPPQQDGYLPPQAGVV